MSYNRAWLLDANGMNRMLPGNRSSSPRGGDSRGGTQLTAFGKEVLAIYQRIESKFIAATRQPLGQILSRLKN